MFLIAIAIVAGTIAFFVLWRELSAGKGQRKLSKLAISSTVVLVATLAVLASTGRLHWLAALVAGTLPFLRWVLGLFLGPLLGHLFRSRFQGATANSQGATGDADGPGVSTVATGDLRMTLVHASGDMDGEILSGSLVGRRLSDLDLASLKTLRDEFHAMDSRQLLEAYLDRRFPGWGDDSTDREPTVSHRSMDREQALAVLGLQSGATEQDIVGAHRRLMQKLHPDRGGTDYLAATLNLAKQVLLKGS